jgi:hypothetical protein
MAKLQKREMIILGVMAVSVLAGAVVSFMPSGKNLPGINLASPSESVDAFINTINASLTQEITKAVNAMVVEKAQQELTYDPFLDSAAYKKMVQAKPALPDGKVTEKKIEFAYMGYIEARGKKMAIINGVEYHEGERLEMKDFVLKSATAKGIVVENTLTGARLSVPLQEE